MVIAGTIAGCCVFFCLGREASHKFKDNRDLGSNAMFGETTVDMDDMMQAWILNIIIIPPVSPVVFISALILALSSATFSFKPDLVMYDAGFHSACGCWR